MWGVGGVERGEGETSVQYLRSRQHIVLGLLLYCYKQTSSPPKQQPRIQDNWEEAPPPFVDKACQTCLASLYKKTNHWSRLQVVLKCSWKSESKILHLRKSYKVFFSKELRRLKTRSKQVQTISELTCPWVSVLPVRTHTMAGRWAWFKALFNITTALVWRKKKIRNQRFITCPFSPCHTNSG